MNNTIAHFKSNMIVFWIATILFIWLTIKWIFRIVFLDSLRGFIKIYELFKGIHISDIEINGMVDQFKDENLEGGWDIILSMKRTTLILWIIVGNIVVQKDDPMYFRVTVLWNLLLVVVIIYDKVFQQWMILQRIKLSCV